ncbi:MAG TPA: hypothetical protein VGR62_11655 [Candidatus Binatia bacterium]|jgi:hypothetical protein|nr:hypothetical protein [Candidatus Binatia bacterium]
MPSPDLCTFADVEVVNATGTALIVRVKQLRVTVPRHDLQDGTTIRNDGDRGALVIPRWLADTLGLT